MAGGFVANTKRRVIPLPGLVKPAGGGQTRIALPKVGLLSSIFLDVRGAIAQGVAGGENVLGKSSVIRRVRLNVNGAVDVINISGPGYHWLLRDFLGMFGDMVGPATDARTAVAVDAALNLGMILPVAVQERDPIGLILLANNETSAELIVEWEADANVATTATVTATATPYLEVFSIPEDPRDRPPLNFVHQTIEDPAVAVAGAGDVTYDWPRGQIYLGVYHGLGLNVTPADAASRIRLRVNQSDFAYDSAVPGGVDLDYTRAHGRARTLGVYPFDLSGSSGLGVFGSARDFIDSSKVSDLASIITATGAGTLYTVRRQLVKV